MKALDYLDMPECIYVNHEVEMSEPERKLYEQLKQDRIIPLEDGDIDAANAASLSNKLLQMSNGAVYDENGETRVIHSRKLKMLEDLIEALPRTTVRFLIRWGGRITSGFVTPTAISTLPICMRSITSVLRCSRAGSTTITLSGPLSAMMPSSH